jgi:hypothetical protein
LISEGVFFGAFIFASSGRRQNDEILGLAFWGTKNATSSQFRASEAHFRVSSCVGIYSTCGPLGPDPR